MAEIDIDHTYNGDGVTSQFAITFDYDNQSQVVVEWSGGTPTYTFINPGNIQLTSPAVLGIRTNSPYLSRN